MEEEVERKTEVHIVWGVLTWTSVYLDLVRDMMLTCTERDRGGRGNSRGSGSHNTNTTWCKTITIAYD